MPIEEFDRFVFHMSDGTIREFLVKDLSGGELTRDEKEVFVLELNSYFQFYQQKIVKVIVHYHKKK